MFLKAMINVATVLAKLDIDQGLIYQTSSFDLSGVASINSGMGFPGSLNTGLGWIDNSNFDFYGDIKKIIGDAEPSTTVL